MDERFEPVILTLLQDVVGHFMPSYSAHTPTCLKRFLTYIGADLLLLTVVCAGVVPVSLNSANLNPA